MISLYKLQLIDKMLHLDQRQSQVLALGGRACIEEGFTALLQGSPMPGPQHASDIRIKVEEKLWVTKS